ncbi:BTAD domain-containing putative transcriptional regulator [Nocardia sp. NPDC051030]|uniref:AfsR/SARP family transcriptional regulator n=1 Tax=Nocardia sp. NPDC051030 TaxID=3155162 RepID=UPI003422C60A
MPVTWRSKKSTNLLALLLMSPGRPVPKESIERALWPSANRPARTSSVKVAVHLLRRALDDEFGPERTVLRIDGVSGAYVLHAGAATTVDVHEFEQLCRSGRVAERHGDTQTARQCYRRALALHSGEFLSKHGEEWCHTPRRWLQAELVRALEVLATYACEDGDFDAVSDYVTKIFSHDAVNEHAFRMLITIHGRMARMDQVQYWYDCCVFRLAYELDVSPTRRTRHLYRRALDGDLVDARHPTSRTSPCRTS